MLTERTVWYRYSGIQVESFVHTGKIHKSKVRIQTEKAFCLLLEDKR